MTTIEERFAHIPEADKEQAVLGFVRLNPSQRGIWFDDMMEMILDSDSHLSIVGDVDVVGDVATKLVAYFAGGATMRKIIGAIALLLALSACGSSGHEGGVHWAHFGVTKSEIDEKTSTCWDALDQLGLHQEDGLRAGLGADGTVGPDPTLYNYIKVRYDANGCVQTHPFHSTLDWSDWDPGLQAEIESWASNGDCISLWDFERGMHTLWGALPMVEYMDAVIARSGCP